MDWFEPNRISGTTAPLRERLRRERLIWDTRDAGDLEILRRDVGRIASDMETPGRSPPLFWSGIPWPNPVVEPSCDSQLVVSVGGTKTDFALLRLEKGQVTGLDVLTGETVSDRERIDRVKRATQMATPRHSPSTPSGREMISQIVDHLAGHLEPHGGALESCQGILLSWGFAHRVVRTGPRLLGGLSALVTKMTKDQAGFTPDLKGKDVGQLFAEAFQTRLGWSRPVAVANDTVMALHYFLRPEERTGHARVGLFINGTGSNFSAAEPYAIRGAGIISGPGEQYEPERITGGRPRRPGESESLYFVNYESGSIELDATGTRFDVDPEYPIERNVLAGGNAFAQSLRELVRELMSEATYDRILEGWSRTGHGDGSVPGAPAVSELAGTGDAFGLLAVMELGEHEHLQLQLIARAIIARSALHAALVLAAVTRRSGFGKGAGSLPDLLGMEGSVWKVPGYQDMVKAYWEDLAGGSLQVDFRSEPSYNASFSGPLYLAAIHR